MNDRMQDIIRQIKKLQEDLTIEIQKKEREFYYEIKKKRVRFEKEIKKLHRSQAMSLFRYITGASFRNVITAPVILSCIIPALMLDAFLSFYQLVCFPAYGIPRVRRGDYIIIDHHYLSYLNIIEKLNCVYCSYFNGLIAYVQEIGARTEQYWCPVKHARKLRTLHSRYKEFLDYGDSEAYRKEFKELRRRFEDIK
jgi:hypothetical protein